MGALLAAVEIRGVTKTYRQGPQDVQALRGIDLSLQAGQVVAIMGASGSGKSTLLHLCAALDRPDQGTIRVAGQTLETMSEKALTAFRRHQIGVIFQQFNLIPTLTARENIALPALLDGMVSEQLHRRIDEMLEVLQMSHRAEHRPDALSGGEQQRVAIARALLLSPPVIFADEPTGNLDSSNAEHFWRLLKTLRLTHPATVMLVTHEPSAAAQADRVVVLRDGRVAGDFLLEERHDARELAARYQALAC